MSFLKWIVIIGECSKLVAPKSAVARYSKLLPSVIKRVTILTPALQCAEGHNSWPACCTGCVINILCITRGCRKLANKENWMRLARAARCEVARAVSFALPHYLRHRLLFPCRSVIEVSWGASLPRYAIVTTQKSTRRPQPFSYQGFFTYFLKNSTKNK